MTKTAVAAFPSPAEILEAIEALPVGEFAELVDELTRLSGRDERPGFRD